MGAAPYRFSGWSVDDPTRESRPQFGTGGCKDSCWHHPITNRAHSQTVLTDEARATSLRIVLSRGFLGSPGQAPQSLRARCLVKGGLGESRNKAVGSEVATASSGTHGEPVDAGGDRMLPTRIHATPDPELCHGLPRWSVNRSARKPRHARVSWRVLAFHCAS